MAVRSSQRAANVSYFARNLDRERERIRSRQAATLAILRDLRRAPCVDCGATLSPHQMDFDHRDPRIKSFRLTAGRAMLAAWDTLLKEVAKCDIVCANCHRLRTRALHAATIAARGSGAASPDDVERRRATWRAQARLLDDLRRVPCADCGRRYEPCAMDFDHREGASKVSGVTRMIGRFGTARKLAEVAKCDIVCANCHRARTYVRREGGAQRAGVAQLVERRPSKADVAGSNPVSRSISRDASR